MGPTSNFVNKKSKPKALKIHGINFRIEPKVPSKTLKFSKLGLATLVYYCF
jgi:hypothetical protein